MQQPSAHQIPQIKELLLDRPDFREGEHWHIEKIPEGGTIISQTEAGRYVYLLESGWARVTGRLQVDGDRSVAPGVCDLGPGEIFGEVVLFEEGKRTASVIAITDCKLWVFDGPRLMQYLEAHPDVGFKFLRLLMRASIRRLTNTNKKVLSLFAWGLRAHQLEG